MHEARKLVVNIVTWDSRLFLPNLFASLNAQTFREFTATVVDNASTDGTVTWLHERHSEVTVLRNFRNQGFARGHNQAIALALSRWPEVDWPERYLLLTNPDIEFAPECLDRLLAAMDADHDLAACGPKLLRTVVTQQTEDVFETKRTRTIDSTGLVVFKSRRVVDRGAGEEDRGQYDRATDVFGVSGACVCLRASTLVEAKLAGEFFDEDFFAYQEDVDLAWRLRRLGQRARFVPEAVAWHHRRVGTPRPRFLAIVHGHREKSPRILELSFRNHLWLLWKNDEFLNLLVHAHRMVPREVLRALLALTSWAVFKGSVAAWFGLSRMWQKRRELTRRAQVSGRGMRRWFV